ncbi:putative transcription elongation factor 1 [Helianthus debilis subsp. tardiflorus]
MGNRKSRAKLGPLKRMDKLDTVFSCPFCNHGTSVECRIFSEWIDDCERVNTVDDDGVPVEDGEVDVDYIAR